MWRKTTLLLPLVLIVVTSGCTLPGGLCIPGFPCAPVYEEENDVYVISSLNAYPEEVSPNQDLRLVAIVENKATRALEGGDSKVTVELYDYCEGLFTIEEGNPSQKIGLIPGEKAEVYWTLHSNKDTKLVSTCNLKIRAKYTYTTNSVTQVYLIDYAEMQRQLNEGTFTEQSSPYSGSFGPLKPYLTVEDTQPIPVSGDTEVSTVFGFQIKNKGNGFLTNCGAESDSGASAGSSVDEGTVTGGQNPGIAADQITITTQGGEGDQLNTLLKDEIDNLNNEKLILIGKESPKLILAVEEWAVGNIPIKTTKVIETTINDYCYEFRKDIDVKVQPKV